MPISQAARIPEKGRRPRPKARGRIEKQCAPATEEIGRPEIGAMTACEMLRLCMICSVVITGGSLLVGQEAGSAFQTAIESSGAADEDGMSNVVADLRTGALSLPGPHAYGIVGGGEWGPRVVAKALLDSMSVDWVNDVYLLDVKEGGAHMPQSEAHEEAPKWLHEHLCKAIKRCPRKAVVVLDNVHLLTGVDVKVLDPLFSLLDGSKSNLECNDRKMSGEGCLFLLLLNDDGPEENKRLSGKARLEKVWEFKGSEFNTAAFVGRIDVAVSLSLEPRLDHVEMEATWEQARTLPSDGMRDIVFQSWREVTAWEERVLQMVKAQWKTVDRGTLRAMGVAAAAATILVTCFALGCFEEATPDNAVDADERLEGGSSGAPGGGGDEKPGRVDGSAREALGMRGGASTINDTPGATENEKGEAASAPSTVAHEATTPPPNTSTDSSACSGAGDGEGRGAKFPRRGRTRQKETGGGSMRPSLSRKAETGTAGAKRSAATETGSKSPRPRRNPRRGQKAKS